MTVKERLEKVKETADLINPDIRWLVEQVERIGELESQVSSLTQTKNLALELLETQTKQVNSKQFQREAMESQIKRLNEKIKRYKKRLKRLEKKLESAKTLNKQYEETLEEIIKIEDDLAGSDIETPIKLVAHFALKGEFE